MFHECTGMGLVLIILRVDALKWLGFKLDHIRIQPSHSQLKAHCTPWEHICRTHWLVKLFPPINKLVLNFSLCFALNNLGFWKGYRIVASVLWLGASLIQFSSKDFLFCRSRLGLTFWLSDVYLVSEVKAFVSSWSIRRLGWTNTTSPCSHSAASLTNKQSFFRPQTTFPFPLFPVLTDRATNIVYFLKLTNDRT